jgi:hypothetical protein
MKVDKCQTNSPDTVAIAILAIEKQIGGSVKSAIVQPPPDLSGMEKVPLQMSLIQLLNTD